MLWAAFRMRLTDGASHQGVSDADASQREAESATRCFATLSDSPPALVSLTTTPLILRQPSQMLDYGLDDEELCVFLSPAR